MDEVNNNIAVKTMVIGFLAEWQGLLYGMRWMIALAIILIVTDLWFGISAAHYRGEKVRRSRAGRRTFNKVVDYLCYIFIGVTIGKAIAEPYGVDPFVTAITAMVLCYGFEIDSIYGHILELHNIKIKYSIWKLLAFILTLRFKQFASAIEDISKQYEIIIIKKKTMATKTYFGFQSQLKSKELTEAIALQHGPGPLFGYAGFSLNGPVITLTPLPDNGDTELKEFRDHFSKLVNDRMASRKVMVQAFDGATGNFGIITKDGYIEVNNANQIDITISNTQSTNSEVIVIARHNYSEDVNIEMPVIYEAYWNQSTTSFFKLYKKAIDFNYPTPLAAREIEGLDINQGPQDDSQLSYNYLSSTALAATGIDLNNLADCTLVGIYGTGNDAMSETGALQKFIILPYDGKFPMELTYSWPDVNFNKDLLRYLYKVFDGMGSMTFAQYIRKLLSESDEEKEVVSVAVPVGTIIMWYGSTSTIPYGWEICDGTASVHNPSIMKPNLMGRFPVGLSTEDSNYNKPGVTGGNNQVTLEINNIPQHNHVYTADDNSEGKFASVETGFPQVYQGASEAVTGTAGSSGNQGVAKAYLTSKVGGNKPIDNRPAYTVVTFIIKTLE